jgi:hypothetical protein
MRTDSTAAGTTPTGWAMSVVKVFVGIILLAVAAFFAGPVNEFGSSSPTVRAEIPANLQEIDDWLVQSEAKFEHLKPGTAKGIVWAHTPHQKTHAHDSAGAAAATHRSTRFRAKIYY